MPELPEVEVVKRGVASALVGQVVLDVPFAAPPRWDGVRGAVGMVVRDVSRKGKYLLLDMDGPHRRVLVVHLGMTGQLLLMPADVGTDSLAHLRALLRFQDAALVLLDPRGFGFAALVSPATLDEPPWSTSTFGRLGQDPLSEQFNAKAAARALLARTGRPAKAVLLEQEVIAGLGNYLCDEILAAARVHPEETRMSRQACRRVVEETLRIVRESVEHGGVSIRDYVHADGRKGSYADYLRVYGRAGLPCLACGATLAKGRVAGRGTTWCPRCQRRSRALATR